MCSMQLVFLFDLDACTEFLLKSKEELNKKLLSIRLACVRLLTDFSTKSPNLKWGFKFFDSCGTITQTMCKYSFSDVSLEAFETLENEICVRYERHIALLQVLAESSQKSASSTNDICKVERASVYPVKVLQFALTQILCEFQWESRNMMSPSTRKIKDRALCMGKRNFLFLFSDFEDNDEMLFKYFGLNHVLSKSKFTNIFLPQALRESLLEKADIHLVFINTCQDHKFMGTLSSCILHLLSETLQLVQGSMIPLSLLSQPLYNMQFVNNSEKTLRGSEIPVISNLYSSFHNSLMPFSSLFQQSLYHLFYSKENSVICKCCINFSNKNVKIPVQVMNILNKKNNLREDIKNAKAPNSLKNGYSTDKRATWSKFVIQFAVSRSVHYAVYEMLLCLPNDCGSNTSEVGLVTLNKSLCLKGINLVLECVTDCGIKMPGLLTPLSSEAAVIFILNPSVNHLLFKSDCKISSINSLEVQNIELENNSCEIQKFKTNIKNSHNDGISAKNSKYSAVKPFQMECMETWFKPTSSISSLAAYIHSKSSNTTSKMKPFYKLLQLSAINSKKLNAKSSKNHIKSVSDVKANSASNNEGTEEVLTDRLSISESENKDMEELPSNLTHEELLSAIKKIYESAIEQSNNIVTLSKRIVSMIINYYKKHKNGCVEEDVQNLFQDNFMLTVRRICEKYEMFDSEEAKEKKVKECQVQVLLILEIENFKMCPDRSSCVSSVTSLLRLMIFFSGIEKLQNFLLDVLHKNYGHNLFDILVEVAYELNMPIFDDEDSTNSPTDSPTVSSELINEEELFSVVSLEMSEKSSSSSGRDKVYKERKLLRRRSDISDTTIRQVVLPRSSFTKKKSKTATNKAVRCSPRIASRKREGHSKSVSEKRTVRRNLFSGDKSNQTPKKNKNNQPRTPRSKKKNHVSKIKYVSETPSHKQNHSALQRRKSFIDKLLNSPKEIAESPQIIKTARDGVNKELLEKLERARLKPSNSTKESSSQDSNCASFRQCTPESNRRLSLKLFSKILSSPTARLGIKKCTKRLFDDVSPKKDGENNKRHKPNDECEQPSNSAAKSENAV